MHNIVLDSCTLTCLSHTITFLAPTGVLPTTAGAACDFLPRDFLAGLPDPESSGIVSYVAAPPVDPWVTAGGGSVGWKAAAVADRVAGASEARVAIMSWIRLLSTQVNYTSWGDIDAVRSHVGLGAWYFKLHKSPQSHRNIPSS